ncbi:MAG: FAD-dependent oxidoreductase [Candidatus Binatia bacterium]
MVGLWDKTDLLVIGGGAAGLMAAVKAREKGVDVLVTLKSITGSSTDRSGGGLALATQGYSSEEHVKDTLESGRFLGDEGLIRILAEEAPVRFGELQNYGLRAEIFQGYAICAGAPASARGSELTRALRNRCDALGVRLRAGFQAVDVMVDQGRVTGVVGFDADGGRSVLVDAKSVVLATGGGGGLYAKTDNDPRNTGDGYAMAYRAGLKLRDMEFVQFYPLGIADEELKAQGFGLFPPNLADVGEIRNAKGENLLEKHNLRVRPVAIKARDLLSRAIFIEIQEGNGVDDSVLLDLTKVDDERWPKDYATLVYKEAFRQKLRCAEKPVLTSPVCHFFIGGVVVNSDCSTSVDGLYVAGETAAGVHGANRMGRNALTDAVVFGARAGESAFAYSSKAGAVKSNAKHASNIADRRIRLSDERGLHAEEIAELKERLRDTMSRYLGVIRDAEGLNKALQIFHDLKRTIQSASANTAEAASTLLEVENALTVSEMVARAALRREESRGAHFRRDFPKEDASWRKNLFVHRADDQMLII